MSDKNKIKRKVVGIKDIYSKYPNKRKVKRKIYYAIVREFLKVYFSEVLYFDKSMYFLFGGLIKKAYVGNFVGFSNSVNRSNVTVFNKSLGFIWYDRPHPYLVVQVKFKKMNGVTGNLTKLIKEWRKTNNLEGLESLVEFTKNNQLYRDNYKKKEK